jgi:hypothetical protein
MAFRGDTNAAYRWAIVRRLARRLSSQPFTAGSPEKKENRP